MATLGTDLCAALLVGTSGCFAWLASGKVISRAFRFSALVCTIAQLILVWCSIVVASLLLHGLGIFRPYLLHLTVGVIWSTVWLFTWKYCTPAQPLDVSESSGSPQKSKNRLPTNWGKILVGLGASQVVLFGLLQLPSDWDTLAYHSPLVSHWVQTSSLSNQRCAFWYVPGNSELLAYWFCAPFSGDFWSQLNNVPVLTILALSVLAIGRELGFDRKWQMTLVVVCVANTTVVRQLTSLENDVSVGALFIAAVLFSLRYITIQDKGSLLLVGACLGLLAGIKYYALGYVAVIGFACTMTVWRFSGVLSAMKLMSVIGLCVLLLGSYWYLRNLVIGGSPIYPKGISLLGMSAPWDTIRPRLSSSSLMFGSSLRVWKLLLWAWLVQSGPLITASLLLAVPTAMFVPFAGRRTSECEPSRHSEIDASSLLETSKTSCFLSVCALGTLMVYVVTPNVVETQPSSLNMLRSQYHSVRFGFPAGVFAAIYVAYAIHLCFRRVGSMFWLVRAAAMILSAVTLLWILAPQYGWQDEFQLLGINVWSPDKRDMHWIEVLLLTLNICIWVFLVVGLRKRWNRPYIMTMIAFSAVSLVLSTRWHSTFDDHFSRILDTEIYKSVRTLAGAAPICVCEYRYYPALGPTREFDVHRPLFFASETHFWEYLVDRDIEWVVVPTIDRHWSKAYEHPRAWLTESPDRFALVETTRDFMIFHRIGPNALRTSDD